MAETYNGKKIIKSRFAGRISTEVEISRTIREVRGILLKLMGLEFDRGRVMNTVHSPGIFERRHKIDKKELEYLIQLEYLNEKLVEHTKTFGKYSKFNDLVLQLIQRVKVALKKEK